MRKNDVAGQPVPQRYIPPSLPDNVVQDWQPQDAAVRRVGGLVSSDGTEPLPGEEHVYRLTRRQLETLLGDYFAEGIWSTR